VLLTYIIFQKLSKVSNRPSGEKSPNQVTLVLLPPTETNVVKTEQFVPFEQ
jgi:hypothetical protein